MFAACADALFEAVEAASAEVLKQREQQEWAAIQDEGQHSSFDSQRAQPHILSSILDTSRVLGGRSMQVTACRVLKV